MEELEEMEVTTIHTDEQEQEQDQDLEQEEDEIVDDPIDDQEVFTLTLTDDSECEDKEYLGKSTVVYKITHYFNKFIVFLSRIHKHANVLPVSR